MQRTQGQAVFHSIAIQTSLFNLDTDFGHCTIYLFAIW